MTGSSGLTEASVPTTVASWPMYRWQKPPILACWYAWAVRVSNSRIRYMSRSHCTSVWVGRASLGLREPLAWPGARVVGLCMGVIEGLAVVDILGLPRTGGGWEGQSPP